MKIFEVGGCVRDFVLGVDSKDIDFTVVLDDTNQTVDEGWDQMVSFLKEEGFQIFLETKDCFTVRAKFPIGHVHEGLVADFVMARKEVGYVLGTRKPILELGTLYDDLIRRDFTLNALARDMDGNIIDHFSGLEHLKKGLLVTPLNPMKTMMDDPLRILRALRFSVTRGFEVSTDIMEAMKQPDILDKLKTTVSQERIREEVTKMMKYDTLLTMKLLVDIDREFIKGFLDVVFRDNMWLKPTTEKR
jgi:tRNA nucleotidyltransferase/poly(A) polymerase